MVTINVPRNKLNPIFFFGFFISPAINVTLFQASLLKIDPTIDAAMAPNNAAPPIPVQLTLPAASAVDVAASSNSVSSSTTSFPLYGITSATAIVPRFRPAMTTGTSVPGL